MAAARFAEHHAREHGAHVILAGDFDATPEAASIRFLSGRQSLEGMRVCYRDAWASAHPDEPGHGPTLDVAGCERLFDEPRDGVWGRPLRRAGGSGDAMSDLRILATTDLGTAVVPMRASYGRTGTVAGIAELLERQPQPAIWVDVGDLTVGPAMALLDEASWDETAELPIACTAAGNHDFDEGLDALRAGAKRLPYPMLCANVDAGLPATARGG